MSALSADRRILTWHAGRWHEGSVPILASADHATWLGSLVFDGARRFDGVCPDLDRHCERVNASARALALQPGLDTGAIVERVREGLAEFDASEAVYIRPMYWSTGYGPGVITPDPSTTDFCLCLEAMPMPSLDATARLTTTRFTRPTLAVATVDAKAACLYPNNARMLAEAISKGFSNAIVADPFGNIAETATSNIFMVRDGEVYTPVPNGTFLNGITRQRLIDLLQRDSVQVHETSLTLEDFRTADEIFMSGNIAKVTPVTALEARELSVGPTTRRARELYFDWAHS